MRVPADFLHPGLSKKPSAIKLGGGANARGAGRADAPDDGPEGLMRDAGADEGPAHRGDLVRTHGCALILAERAAGRLLEARDVEIDLLGEACVEKGEDGEIAVDAGLDLG